MRTKIIALGLLASTAFAGAVFAQQNSTAAGSWRASKLIGVNVYNEQNDKLGDIEEILVDKSGKVDGVILGVGGFLGMGEHYIKVSMDKLRFENDKPRGSAVTATNTNRPVNATTTAANTDAKVNANANAETRATKADDHKWYPDHAILGNATKDQLKAMPQFKYD